MSDSTSGKPIKCKAAVCWGINKPITVEEIEVAPPKKGEVRFKVISAGVCHSDLSIWNGSMGPDIGPIILGHEGAGIVESVGEGVTSFKPGDHVIPMFVPQCNKCPMCKDPRTNLCDVGTPFGNSTLLEGTSRFSTKGKTLYHMSYCSVFSQYSVSDEITLAKINPAVPMEKAGLFGCCVPTGYGAAINTAKVQPGTTCAVWGLGAVGLCTIMGCKASGASRIIGIDVNPDKFDVAKRVGCTDVVNPKDYPDRRIQDVLIEMTNGGLDYTFECIGNIACIESALESCKKGWGTSVVVGIPPGGKTLTAPPFALIQGRTWKGTFAGGVKGKDGIPALCEEYLKGKIDLDALITHNLTLDKVNEAFDMMIAGKSIRAMILPWK